MANFDKEEIFSAEAITDTAAHYSVVSDNRATPTETIAVKNDHDEEGTFQFEGSNDVAFDDVWKIGSSFTVPANTKSSEDTTKYFPWVRLKVTYATAPSTGTLTAHLFKVG